MTTRFAASMSTAAVMTVLAAAPIAAQAPAATAKRRAAAAPWTPPKTPWGDPDLQGSWPTASLVARRSNARRSSVSGGCSRTKRSRPARSNTPMTRSGWRNPPRPAPTSTTGPARLPTGAREGCAKRRR